MQEILPGTEVLARNLRWEVVMSQQLGAQTLYRLRGLEMDLTGAEIDLLTPFEPITPVIHEIQPEKAAPLTNWLVYHQAFLLEQALGPNALLAAQPGRLRIEPYQLVPVLRAIRMSRVRLLLADGVGLGKTIQAGLVLTELVARRLAHRILIVSPAGPLLEQWHLEMRERFGLRLEIIDRAKLEDIRRSTELGSNPFDHIALGLVSIDFLKQERVLDQLERATYDVIVIDEAHHCMDAGAAQDREDSQRRRLAEVLSRQCDSLLLLTATPHDGNDRSFASLCDLMDPSLVDGKGVLRGNHYRDHVIRRLKKHVQVPDPENPGQKKALFPERVVTPIPVTPKNEKHARFIEMQRELLDLIAPELRRSFSNKSYSDVLAWMAMLKRSVSTVKACGETLRVVADRFQHFLTETAESQETRRQRIRTLRDYERKIERFGSITPEEESERSLLEAEDIAQQLAGLQREIRRGTYKQAKISDVLMALENLVEKSEDARKQDPKLDELVHSIQEIRKAEPRANILIYTEYIDSQQAAVASIKDADVGPVITMSGEDDDKTRSKITERFRTQDNLILVSTDSSAEGINLHQRCHHLIHLELPFNPNRLEQRNGRIDRYGQTQEPHVRYLYLRGTFEERILLRLIAKYEKQRARLTFVPNTLGLATSTEATQVRLLKGLIDEDRKLFKEEPAVFNFSTGDENKDTDPATQELLEEIDRSLRGFREATRLNTWLGDAGLNAENRLFEEANQARDRGHQAERVDLVKFVMDAVLLDGGDIIGDISNNIFSLRLPPTWLHGMDDLPGYDAGNRVVRLTTDIPITSDEHENDVGFLGRAHPLVRRALDRVRNLSFGGMAKSGQDPRASVVKTTVKEPSVLYTFLGRVSSTSGRELERVIALKIDKSGQSTFFESTDQWMRSADPQKAIRTTDVWKDHFKAWAESRNQQAIDMTRSFFKPMAEAFIKERLSALNRERLSQDEWLKKRADEICAAGDTFKATQLGLFEPKPASTPVVTSPADNSDPVKRLSMFHLDRTQPPAARAEAEGVLRIYKQRISDLDSLSEMREPEIIPLGVLMIVPETQGD